MVSMTYVAIDRTGYAVVVGTIAGICDVAAPAVSRAMVLDCGTGGFRGGVLWAEDCCSESYGVGGYGVND